MTTKEWLMGAWHIDRDIHALLSEKHKAFDRCVSTQVRPKEVVVSGGGDSYPMVQYADLEKKIDERVDELHMVKVQNLDAIKTVPDCTLRTLLIEGYINFRTWEQIAVNIDKSFQWTCILHGRALKENN